MELYSDFWFRTHSWDGFFYLLEFIIEEKTNTRAFPMKKEVASIVLDPHLETAVVDMNNIYWPSRVVPIRFGVFKQKNIRNQIQCEKQKNKIKTDRVTPWNRISSVRAIA